SWHPRPPIYPGPRCVAISIQGTNFVTTGSTGTYNATSPVNVASGDPIKVSLFYNAAAETLTESLADTTTGGVYTHTYTGIDLATTLGGSTAILGFTGGTGGSTSTQVISNFTFTSQPSIVAGGTDISLWAGGRRGTATAPLLIDLTGNAACVLNASAQNSIYIKHMGGSLYLGNVVSATENVVLDPSNHGDDLILGSSSNVSAPQGQVTLQAAQGDVMLSSGSVVNALEVRILGGSSNPVETGTGSQITLAGIINALSVDVVGGSGGDTVTVSQAGLNADLNVEGGLGQNQFILQGAGGNNQFLLNGLHKIVTSGIQTLNINGGAGDNLFQVLSTLAGPHSTLAGGSGSNTFWIGSNGTTGNGTLDGILGAIQVTDAGNGTGASNELD